MPDVVDYLGAPKVVTGADYMHALAALGYNVENMSSPIPTMTKIASAQTNFLDNLYNQNLDRQAKQANLQETLARANNLDSVTDYNNKSLNLRLNDLDLRNQELKQQIDFAQQAQPFKQRALERQDQEGDITLDAAKRAHDEADQALNQWKQASPSYPSVTDPDYTTKRAKWMDDNRLVITNPTTAPKVQDLVTRSDNAYGALSQNQVKQAEVQRFTDFQKSNHISPLYNGDVVANTDQGQDLMVRASLAKLSDDLGATIGSLPTGITGPMGQQIEDLRQKLIGERTQVNSYAQSDDRVGEIRKGGNVNVTPRGEARGDILGDMTRAKVMNDEFVKRGLVEQKETIKLPTAEPKGQRAPSEVEITGPPGTSAYVSSHPWEYSPVYRKGSTVPYWEEGKAPQAFRGMPTEPGKPSPQAPALPPEEATRRQQEVNAILQSDPSPETRELAQSYLRGQLTPSGFQEQLRTRWSGGRTAAQGSSGFLAQPEVVNDPIFQQIRADALSGADPLPGNVKPGTPQGDQALWEKYVTEKRAKGQTVPGLKMQEGGLVLGAGGLPADGGLISGAAGTDQVPAMLTRGEYVVPKDAVQDIGVSNLEALTGGTGATPVRGSAVTDTEPTFNLASGTRPPVSTGTQQDVQFQQPQQTSAFQELFGGVPYQPSVDAPPPGQSPNIPVRAQIPVIRPQLTQPTRQAEQPATQTAQTAQTAQTTQAPRAELVSTPAVTTGPATTALTSTGGTTLMPKYTTGDAFLNAHYLGDGKLSGLATNFGHDVNGRPDTYMLSKLGGGSRIGAFGTDVVNPTTVGASVPRQTFNAFVGNPNDPQVRQRVQSGRVGVEVWAPNGRSARFPIVDLGPGKGENASLDLTGSAMRQLGMSDNFGAVYRIYSQ